VFRAPRSPSAWSQTSRAPPLPRATQPYPQPLAFGADASADVPSPATSLASVDVAPDGNCEPSLASQYACVQAERACASGGFDPAPLVSELYLKVLCCASAVRAQFGVATLHLLVSSEGIVDTVVAEPGAGPASDPAFLACLRRASQSIRWDGPRGPAKVTWTFRLKSFCKW
jgi:hypothetical protein